jgi:ATP-dependent protease ClpP protease subunit
MSSEMHWRNSKMAKTEKFKKFWNVASTDGETGDLNLYGEIRSKHPTDWLGDKIEGDYITPQGFREDMEALADKKKINVHINSVGGDLYTGIAIHNVLKGMDKEINVIVEGIAASAASVIAMAGDTIQMYPGALMMIHGVSTLVWDYMNLEDIDKLRNAVQAMNDAITNIYHERTGIEKAEISEMIKAETWMTGEDAVNRGFADESLPDDENDDMVAMVNMGISPDKKFIFVNKAQLPTDGMKHIPTYIPTVRNTANPVKKTASNKSKAHKQVQKGAVNSMNIEELKKQYPDLVAQIVQEAQNAAAAEMQNKISDAVNAERNRIKDIDAIAASIPDSNMVNEAKYGENAMDAKTLCFEAMKKGAQEGTNFLMNLEKGAEESGANAVNSVSSTEEPEADEVAAAINAVKIALGGK